MIRNNKTFKAWMAVAIVVAILLFDQIIKIEVKTNMTLGEAKRVTGLVLYLNLLRITEWLMV